MSGDEHDVRHELTVQILTQIRDSLDLIRRKQDTFDGSLREFGGDIHAISERTARLEERNERFTRIENENARLAGQVELLVADKNKRDGAIGAWSWLANNWPVAGLATALGALVAYANGLIGGKP